MKKSKKKASAKMSAIYQSSREDLLGCKSCGLHEEVSPEENKFLIIDHKDRFTKRKGIIYFSSNYTFICSHCGLYQKAVYISDLN